MAAEYLQRMGERMAERRKELGLTQEQVARQLPGETSGAHVSRWERGLHRPSDDTLEALAKTLHVDVAYFLAAPADKSQDTPDPFGRDGQTDRVEARLERMDDALAHLVAKTAARTDHDQKVDQLLEQQNDLLARQSQILTRIEHLLLNISPDAPAEEPAIPRYPHRPPGEDQQRASSDPQ